MGIQHRGGTSIKRLGSTGYWTEKGWKHETEVESNNKIAVEAWSGHDGGHGQRDDIIRGGETRIHHQRKKKKEKRNRKDKVNSMGTNV